MVFFEPLLNYAIYKTPSFGKVFFSCFLGKDVGWIWEILLNLIQIHLVSFLKRKLIIPGVHSCITNKEAVSTPIKRRNI